MKLKLVSPESLITEGVEAKDVPAAIQQLPRVVVNIAEKHEARIVFCILVAIFRHCCQNYTSG
jgi:hypothetical protein